jgi:ubiquinone/menaquinone biosynthesis C-methylase UbiE
MNTFDPARYKATTREQWEAAAEAWHRWGPLLEQWLGTATQRMLDVAGVATGSHVLDVAAGAGGQSLAAARRTGPTGRVVAADISPAILRYAAQSAAQAGVAIETRELDGEAVDAPQIGSFNAVISRLGLIYFPNQHRALSGMRQVLRERGRFGAIVYSTPERNEFFSIPVRIIRTRAQLAPPAPGQPGPFSLGTPEALKGVLSEAGFRDVSVQALEAPLRLPSAAECVRFQRESFGALHQMLSSLPAGEQAAVWREIEDALARFETHGGFIGPCELLIVGAAR